MLNYIKLWGVRGSYPAPQGSHLRVGGNTACVEFCVDGYRLICDAGTGIIPLGNHLARQHGNSPQELCLLISHYHWDHISGLPFFVPAFMPNWTINVYAPGDSSAEIETYIAGQMQPPYFPVEVEVWQAKMHYRHTQQRQIQYGPFVINAFYVHHPGITLGYLIKVHDKVIAYMSDNELSFIDRSIEVRKNELNPRETELILAMAKEEWDNAVQQIKGIDILLHDAQYTPEDYQKKQGWGHSCYLDTIDFALDAKVKDLYLFHMDPAYDDDFVDNIYEKALKYCQQYSNTLRCHIARETLLIPL
jgi:phosphoribosyl 1,2-cyclic phosphodiesterase